MKIYQYKPDTPLGIGGCVVAIGLFDGFHTAHRGLLSKAKELAEQNGLSFGIFTFTSDRTIKEKSKKIYSTEEKLEIARALGADFAVISKFSDISDFTAEDFVQKTLIRDISAKIAVAGFNFRFGKGALGNAEALKALMKEGGGDAYIFDEYTSGGAAVSSTRIRELLSEGRMEEARLLLGEPYFLTGVVSHGDGRGKSLGLPTVNTDIPEEKIIPRRGVYRSGVMLGDKVYSGVTNVGTCPTFGERPTHAETYILDFDEELYGRNIKVYLLEFLREEKSFDSQEDLVMQIKLDINYTIKKNGDLKWQELGLK